MFRAIRVITINTFRETVRDKLLYSLIAFAALMIGASLLAGSVSLGQDVRVIQNFSLTALLVFLLLITIFIGTQLVYREIERKTVSLVLSKPVTREAFYLGKFFGLCLTIAVAAAIMGGLFLILLWIKTKTFSADAVLAVIFTVFEAWLLTAVGLLFSSFTSPLASAVYTFCLLLIGHSSSSIWLIAQKGNTFTKGVLEFAYYTFPNLEKFNLRNEVVFHLHPDPIQLVTVIGYFIGYTATILFLGMAVFRRHEF